MLIRFDANTDMGATNTLHFANKDGSHDWGGNLMRILPKYGLDTFTGIASHFPIYIDEGDCVIAIEEVKYEDQIKTMA